MDKSGGEFVSVDTTIPFCLTGDVGPCTSGPGNNCIF